MPLPRTAGDWKLEGEVLLASEQEKIAHRGIVVSSTQHGIRSNAHVGREAKRIGWKPASGAHGSRELHLRTDQRNV
jgi:hypothetical protein